ncbi:MAG: flagellar assembly protein FliX, partial [Pseudomonadota bacterium]
SEGRGGARNRATAERILMLLERLRDGLLAGRIAVSDLSALAIAADAKLNDPDEAIASLHAEIALRARVELAKLGHS